MAEFFYKAKQGLHKTVEGVLSSDSYEKAVAVILRKGLTPIDVRLKDSQQANPLTVNFAWPKLQTKITHADLVFFTRQVSDLVDAEIPILRALEIVQRQAKVLSFKEMLQNIYQDVQDGRAFSDSLAKFPDHFSPLYVNLIRAGEMSGSLNVVMGRLADLLERNQELRSRIRASLLYPSMIVIVGCGTVFFLLTWVVPRLSYVFEGLGSNLPFITSALLNISHFFARYWWGILGILAILGLYGARITSTPSGRYKWDNFKLRLPFFGKYVHWLEAARSARTLGTLLENGVVIVSALKALESIVDNTVLRSEAEGITEEVRNGTSLTRAVRGKKFFPEIAVNMIAVGEESGRTFQGLLKVAAYYERQTQRMMNTMITLLQPALILLVGLVIGFVVIAMLLPLFKMNTIL